MPAIRPNWRSSGVATDEAMISGLAPGKTCLHVDGGKIDLRQRRHRQHHERNDSRQRNGHRQKRGRHRPVDEWR